MKRMSVFVVTASSDKPKPRPNVPIAVATVVAQRKLWRERAAGDVAIGTVNDAVPVAEQRL